MIQNFGFEYVKALAHAFYGITDVILVKAEGLDIWGNNPEEILQQAKHKVPRILNA